MNIPQMEIAPASKMDVVGFMRASCRIVAITAPAGGPPYNPLRFTAYSIAASGTLNSLMAPLPMNPRSSIPTLLV